VLPPGTLGPGAYFAEPGVTGSARPDAWYAGSSSNELFIGTIPVSALGSWNIRSLALADFWAGSPPPNYPATPFGGKYTKIHSTQSTSNSLSNLLGNLSRPSAVLTSPVAVPAGSGGDRVFVASGDGYVYALNVDACLAGGMASAGCLAWPRPFGSSVAPPVGPQGFFTSPRYVSLVGGHNFLVVAETSALINAAGVWHVLNADSGAEIFNVTDNLDAGAYGIFGIEPCIDDSGPHPDILFLMLGTNIVAYNITTGRFLDNGGAPTGGDPISSSCTCIVTQSSGAVFAQSSGPKELTLFRFNLNANVPDGTERGGGFVSFYACSFTPGSSTCTRRSEPPEGRPPSERSAPGGFYVPTSLSERDELLALLLSAYERAHGAEQLRAVSDALAGQPALLAAALARALPLETLNALAAPSGYRRLGHGRLGLAAPSGFIPTAVPTLTADDAEVVFPQHNPSSPFTSKAQVPAGAIFYVDDGSHTVKWQMRGVGTYTADFSAPFYSIASSASSVTIDAAGIGYAGIDANNNWNIPYPPYSPGDPQVNRTTYPVSGAPAAWSVPAVIAFNVSTGALLWAKTLGAGVVADDSPAIMAPAKGAAGPGILLITSPDPQNGGVISIWAGSSCPSTDPLFDCSGRGDCDSCGGGSCSCDPTTCFTGFACADPVDCGPGGSCAPGVGGCVCEACWLPNELGSCTVAQDCSGHGSCLPIDGSCDCSAGWAGSTCQNQVPSASPTASASASAAPAAGAAAVAGAGAAGPGSVAAGILVPALLVALGVAALKRAHPTLSLFDAAARTGAAAQLRVAEALGAAMDSGGDRRRPLMTSSPVRSLAPAPAAAAASAAASETASLLGPLHEARRARATSTSPPKPAALRVGRVDSV
jgi:hypothetical protein